MRYRYGRVFSLTQWSGLIHAKFHVLDATWEYDKLALLFRIQDYHLLWFSFPTNSAKAKSSLLCYLNTIAIPHYTTIATVRSFNTIEVWATPRSLVTTKGISYDFFSSRY